MPATRPTPPPLRRWSEVWRIVAAVVLGLALWTFQVTEDMAEDSLLPLLDLVVGTGAIIAMHWRRRWPATIAVSTALATSVSAFAVVASLIAFVSLVTTRRWLPVAAASAIGCVGAFASERLIETSTDLPWWSTPVAGLALYGVAVLIGLYVGARRELVASYRERAETAEREQAVRVDQARLGERARIAREMHDVLAHRISLLSLHAGAMTFRADLDAEELRASARIVQDNAHQASLDLRDVLGVLRDPSLNDPETAGAVPDRPQPTLTDLPDLIHQARLAGTEIALTDDLPEGQAPPTMTGRTAYRIIQEALTNVRKHAPGATVALRLTGHPGGRLDIEMRNGVPDAFGPAIEKVPGSGLGLIGLAERAGLAGGQLEHGLISGREYRVHAWLPWPT